MRGMNRRALTIVGLTLLLVFILMLCVFFSVPVRRHFEKRKTLTYRMEVLYETLFEYTKSHDGRLPTANSWCDELVQFDKTISKKIFKSGWVDNSYPCHIAFNKNVSNAQLSGLPRNTILLFAAEGKWNLSGSEEQIVDAKGIQYLLANGIAIICWREANVYKSNQSTEKKLNWQSNTLSEAEKK